MSLELNGDLEKFYNSVNGKLSNCSSVISKYSSNLGSLTAMNSNYISQVKSSFNSPGINESASSVSSINSEINSLKSIFDGVMNSAVTKAGSLLTDIGKLKQYISEYNEIKSRRDSLISQINGLGNDEANVQTKNSLNSQKSSFDTQLSTIESNFNKLHDASKQVLTELKGIEAEASSSASISSGVSTPVTPIIGGGDLGNLTFKTLDNGWKQAISKYGDMEYILYLPPNFDSSKKHAMVTYLTGDTSNKNFDTGHGAANLEGAIRQGISAELNEKKSMFNADCVVLCPVNLPGQKYSMDLSCSSALKKLSDAAINTLNIDPKKNILTGCSSGGISCVYLGGKYPGYWSDIYPLDSEYPSSQKNLSYKEIVNGLKCSNVVCISGNRDTDTNHGADHTTLDKLIDDVNAAGGNMKKILVSGGHTAGANTYVRDSTKFSDIVTAIINESRD